MKTAAISLAVLLSTSFQGQVLASDQEQDNKKGTSTPSLIRVEFEEAMKDVSKRMELANALVALQDRINRNNQENNPGNMRAGVPSPAADRAIAKSKENIKNVKVATVLKESLQNVRDDLFNRLSQPDKGGVNLIRQRLDSPSSSEDIK